VANGASAGIPRCAAAVEQCGVFWDKACLSYPVSAVGCEACREIRTCSLLKFEVSRKLKGGEKLLPVWLKVFWQVCVNPRWRKITDGLKELLREFKSSRSLRGCSLNQPHC